MSINTMITLPLDSDSGLMERSLLRPHVPVSPQPWEFSVWTAWMCSSEGLLYHSLRG